MIIKGGPRIKLEDKYLMYLFHILYLLNSTNSAQKILVMVEKDVKDCHTWFHGRPKSSHFFQIGLIIFGDFGFCALIKGLLKLYRTADPTEGLLHHFDFEVMDKFSLPNAESYLASFVGDAISYFRTKHEVLTFHEVVHTVFELRNSISCI